MFKKIFDKYNDLEHKNKEDKNNKNLKRCKECHNELIVELRQTRCADEGMTIFYICHNCSKTRKH